MRILLLVDCYLPSPKSGAKQMHDLGVEFSRLGHEVVVLAPDRNVLGPLRIDVEDGVCVVRVRSRDFKAASRPSRAFHEARLSSHLWNAAQGFLACHACDLVVFYSPTIFLAELVRKLKAQWRCPAYLILRDIFPQWALDLGILREGPVLSYFRRKERQQYAVADVIAVQSHGDLDYFARGFPEFDGRLEVLHNWAATEERNLPLARYRSELGWEGKVVFFYGGNIGVAQAMDSIVRLAANLSPIDSIRFLLVGDGSAVAAVRQSIAARRLKNIRLLPPVGQREYLAMTAEFDVGLVSLDRRLNTHNVPGKILSYLFAGIPVLAGVNPGSDLFHLLHESGSGLCFSNGDDAALAAAALRLADEPSLRAAMGRKARALLERKFSAPAAAQRILQRVSGPARDPDAPALVPVQCPASSSCAE